MYARTHKKFASFCWLTFLLAYILLSVNQVNLIKNIVYPLLLITVIRFVSIIPDVDTPYSKVGRFVHLKILEPHRGPSHSLIMVFAIGLLTLPIIFFAKWLIWVWIAIVIGYTSHILTDLLTDKGVCLFYPIKKQRVTNFSKFRTGFEQEQSFAMYTDIGNIVAIILLIVIIYFKGIVI